MEKWLTVGPRMGEMRHDHGSAAGKDANVGQKVSAGSFTHDLPSDCSTVDNIMGAQEWQETCCVY